MNSKIIAGIIILVLIVVAVPEGLVMSVVLSQCYNMRKMKKGNTLIRKNSATETIGAVTVICTDKTGTIIKIKNPTKMVNEIINKLFFFNINIIYFNVFIKIF